MSTSPSHDLPCTRATDRMTLLDKMDEVARAAGATMVAAAQAGSGAAFEQLYREHVGRVYALCLRLCADAGAAEELTQDVFVRAWEKLATFRGESTFATWLHRLTINLALGQRRTDQRRSARVIFTDDLTVFGGSAASGATEGARLDLDAALAALPTATRTVFVMHEVEGYTHQEIANLTGRAEGTCKTLLHRARRILRERLL